MYGRYVCMSVCACVCTCSCCKYGSRWAGGGWGQTGVVAVFHSGLALLVFREGSYLLWCMRRVQMQYIFPLYFRILLRNGKLYLK